jgi:hypothetical protein
MTDKKYGTGQRAPTIAKTDTVVLYNWLEILLMLVVLEQ